MVRPTIAWSMLLCLGLSAPAKDGWHRSLEEGQAEAARSNKPIFLVFRCER